MVVSVAQLAEWTQGTLHGDGSRVITSAMPLAEADEHSITFISDRKSLRRLAETKAGAIFLPRNFEPATIPTIFVDDPLSAILNVAARFRPPAAEPSAGVHPQAVIDPSAKVGAGVYIGPLAVVGPDCVIGSGARVYPHAVLGAQCQLGENAVLHSHAVLYPQTTVGARSVIHSGCVIGSDGFGYKFANGRHNKVPQIGWVEIAEDVEIGANTTIDRGTFGPTRIGAGTKVDNQVMIAHNCQIGKHNILVSQTGIAGSSSTGAGVVLAGKVGVADHVHIGDRAIVGAGSGVHADVPAGAIYIGYPARPQGETKRLNRLYELLPEMREQLNEVCKTLGIDKDRAEKSTKESEMRAAG